MATMEYNCFSFARFWVLKINDTPAYIMRASTKPDPIDFPVTLLTGWDLEVKEIRIKEIEE